MKLAERETLEHPFPEKTEYLRPFHIIFTINKGQRIQEKVIPNSIRFSIAK